MVALRSLLAAGLLALASAPAARAGEPFRVVEAQKACLTGNPTKGVEILTDLYLESGAPD